MAKRYTDSNKWKKRFFRELPPEYKLLWLWIHDDCDHAGIWEVDFEMAKTRLKVDLDIEKAKRLFEYQFEEVDGGDRWFLPGFLEFQYGVTLNPKNKVHESVLKILKEHSIDTEVYL